jgi:1,4-dihydroxy-2-naphthoate octaprenyltransferase
VPVVVGTIIGGFVSPSRAVLALLVGVGLQVGVNYANDYFDGVRGVDTPDRLGPPRLVASGMASAGSVRGAAIVAFGIATGSGVVLAALASPALLGVGAVAILAAVLYSGGPRPYAGLGLGELAVFVFFGLVATAGSAYVQVQAELQQFGTSELFTAGSSIPDAAWWAGSAVGLLAVAILVVNNARDIETDARAGKRTLAVRMGLERTRTLFVLLLIAAPVVVAAGIVAGALPTLALLALLAFPLRIRTYGMWPRRGSVDWRRLLMGTALFHAVFGALLALGLAIEAVRT